jgi:hypothetical protein
MERHAGELSYLIEALVKKKKRIRKLEMNPKKQMRLKIQRILDLHDISEENEKVDMGRVHMDRVAELKVGRD